MFLEDLFGYISAWHFYHNHGNKEWNWQMYKIKETSPEMLIYRFSNKKELLKIWITSTSWTLHVMHTKRVQLRWPKYGWTFLQCMHASNCPFPSLCRGWKLPRSREWSPSLCTFSTTSVQVILHWTNRHCDYLPPSFHTTCSYQCWG